MTRRPIIAAFALCVAYVASGYGASGFSQTSRRPANAGRDTLPARLSSQAFWKLATDLSEPDGKFRSDNLVSNEIRFQSVVPELIGKARPGGVYLGVGPEQNFTYIAALRSKMAFIVDVRRGNADLHFLYKALFELSADRADFVSRLLSRPRPPGLSAASTAAEIFNAFAAVDPNDRMITETLAMIRNQLVTVHRFPLTGDDLSRIEAIHRVFLLAGTRIQYSPFGSFGGTVQPTYADLMTATDEAGQARSFLASEQAFAFIKDLQQRNVIIPVVGNFVGPKTLRAIAGYVRRHGAIVSAFYVSNVEEYLRQDRTWPVFCASVARLPADGTSSLIRAVRVGPLDPAMEGFATRLFDMTAEAKQCAAPGL